MTLLPFVFLCGLFVIGSADLEGLSSDGPEPVPPPPPSFPLSSLDEDSDNSFGVQDKNSTDDDEVPMSDDARVRMVLYPRRPARIVTTHVRHARTRTAPELEDEEKKKAESNNKDKTSTTTSIHLESPTSVHMTVDDSDNTDHVQVVALPRATEMQNDKGEDALRQMYWWAHQNYPRSASLVEYRSGNPVVMTLTDSQIAWINSLHPELRDQYLRDIYVVRAGESAETRAQSLLRRYEDAYGYYHAPYYVRQPVSLISRDPISIYDYSCNQANSYFVKAPKLPNAHIARYDSRQNPNSPQNHYLTAIYRCNPGYIMLDTRFTELHCSKRNWIGTEPICVPRS